MTTPVQTRPNQEQFEQAEQQWDLKRLYCDLANVKGGHLTDKQMLHLRGLLCGYSPVDIAAKLSKGVNTVENSLSVIYSYIKELPAVGKKIPNWRSASTYLEEAGYKKSPAVFSLNKSPEGTGLPIKIESMMGTIIINQYNHSNQ